MNTGVNHGCISVKCKAWTEVNEWFDQSGRHRVPSLSQTLVYDISSCPLCSYLPSNSHNDFFVTDDPTFLLDRENRHYFSS